MAGEKRFLLEKKYRLQLRTAMTEWIDSQKWKSRYWDIFSLRLLSDDPLSLRKLAMRWKLSPRAERPRVLEAILLTAMRRCMEKRRKSAFKTAVLEAIEQYWRGSR